MKIARSLIIVLACVVLFVAFVFGVWRENVSKNIQFSEGEQTNADVQKDSDEGEKYNILLLGEDESERLTDVLIIVPVGHLVQSIA